MKQVLKRFALSLAALFLLFYMGFHIYRGFSGSAVTEIVKMVTAYETVDTTGLVFRDETVVDKKADGYFYYTVADGNRVSKNGTIANVFPSLQDALGQQELDLLDQEIDTLTSINEQGTTHRANLSSINQQINKIWLSISRAAQSSQYVDITEDRAELLALLNKKQLTVGKVSDYTERLATLKARREQLEASFTKATDRIVSPVAGYFISRVDGFETILSIDGVESLSVEQLQACLTMEPTAVGESVGKVVGDYEWYMACIVPLEQTAFIKKGTALEVRLPFVMNGTVPAQVVAVNKGAGDNAAVVLQCTHMSGELSAIRQEQVELRLTSYTGLRVPDKAIRFNEAQEPGVFVQDGNYLSFRRIRVLYHDEKQSFSVCEVVDETGFLELYDRIVTEGEDLYDGKLVR